MAQTLTKGFISGLLRSWLIFSRRTATQAGFVLPTTILLLLVVTLTVGAIGYRTFTRTQQTIGERQQRVIYNAATPAIDRAKAKIEFLFSPDRDRRSGGVPSQAQLLGMMLNDGRDLGGNVRVQPLPGDDPYKLPGESRIDINGDGVVDNAWRYKADLDGDGTTDGANDGTVVYSILFTAPADPATLRSQNVAARATARPFPFIRNAPLSNATQATSACKIRSGTTTGTGTETFVPINNDGWFPDEVNTTKLRKNFQVDAYVLPNSPNGTIATLEFQQDREATQGFKWAAWFRNDLEIFPGPAFNWNGAMHTQGNLIVGGSSFRGYMISSKDSCLYTEEASKLTTADIKAEPSREIPAFQGQFITGTIRDNNYNNGSRFDLFAGPGRDPVENRTMDANSDSITPTNGRRPADYSLDPIGIQANGISVGRTVPNPAVDKDTTGTPAWNETNQFFPRMVYANEDTPYVDDTFRADNRYGPYPRYGRKSDQIPGFIGADISGNIELTGDEPPPGSDSTSVGLDGYWERRARRDGLRLLVSQRLELGDPAGWGGPSPDGVDLANEPLKPWDICPSNSSGRCNEARQRRSLWDNLSSVQATAVYHAQSPNGVDFPAACLATTVHPGTAGTLDKSATFENLAYGLPTPAFSPPVTSGRDPYLAAGGRSLITSDFFRGRGTNGWEFSAPPTTAFTSSATSNPWMNALRNLAQFAGDPNGGAPSFTSVQGAINQDQVHPYPLMSMWGDFSMLRRVIGLMDSGVTYANLSPADKTTLHTAGCVIGMLAYNVDYLEKFDVANVEADTQGRLLIGDANVTNPSASNFSTGLRGTLRLILRRNDPAVLALPAATRLPDSIRRPTALTTITSAMLADMAFESGSNDPETFIRLMERWRNDPSTSAARRDELNKQIYLAQLIISKEQVARDRRFGFFPNRLADSPLGRCTAWEGMLPPSGTEEVRRANSEPLFSLCSRRPHFPVLYSLFPAYVLSSTTVPPATVEAGYSGGFLNHRDLSDSVQAALVREAPDDYIRTSNTGATLLYRVVRPETVASVPLGITGTTLGSATRSWTLPVVSTGTNGSTPNSNRNSLIKICTNDTPCSQPTSSTNRIPRPGALYRTAFKDAALFNGREMLSVRTLDLDLDLMRSTAIGTDSWLPKSGLVYAFREDAVSEAHIVRPYRSTWEICKTDLKLRTDTNCQMNTGSVDALASTDPPVSSDRKITPKPVDYYADPDRRPHGFRLRNGASLGRTGDDGRGLAFISHNPVYVMGHFNLHRAPGVTSTARTDGLEEFIKAQQLADDFSNFYTRKDLDLTFARPESDQWRPSEVLADAVTPLSTEFCDGSIQDGMYAVTESLLSNQARDRYGCSSGNVTSYLNQDRVLLPPILTGAAIGKGVKWMRSTLADSYPTTLPNAVLENPAEGESPIVFRNGNPMTFSGTIPNEHLAGYAAMNAGKTQINASDGIQMNMIMVSGLIPSRPNQSYGGLHNFPRFIENWDGDDLFISGAFLQLSFSTYATAPFDQDRWEVSTTPDGSTNEDIAYYRPPNRRWGYDVGLQYAKAGPVAQRFKFAEAIRSEFYTEPAANDPYIANLRNCAQPATCSAP
jgi:hypothetical protein